MQLSNLFKTLISALVVLAATYVGGSSAPAQNHSGKKWLWSDGSYSGIEKTITEGVSQPKQYRSPMPPMGGAQLTADQISALAAYVWGLSHHSRSNRN